MNIKSSISMRIASFLFLSFLPFLLTAQITGKVISESNEPLIGATVFWQNTTVGTTTDVNGTFSIEKNEDGINELVATFVGYEAITLKIVDNQSIEFILSESAMLKEVVVTEKGDDISISNIRTIKSENIGEGELKKAACCDLAGCFETQLTVEPQTTNVVTNAKELRINGLSGVYNQVLINGFPMIQGLSYTYGISSVPGTAVQNIFISKGANSVLQGYENISGQINVITKNPAKTDKLLLNLYANSFGETQANANFAFKLKKDWSNLLVLHSTQKAQKFDRDKDNFLDLPQLTRYMVSNTWKLRNSGDWGWSSEIGIRYLNENRTGGQVNYNPETDQGSNTVYGQTVKLSQPEIYSKTSYQFNDTHGYSAFVSAYNQTQNSYFGTVKYDANQTSIYANLQYEFDYGEKNALRTGASFRYLKLDEELAFTDNTLERTYAGDYLKKEQIPGLFAENTLSLLDGRFTWIAGLRADSHDEFGWTVTPRSLIKYDLSERATVRANIGTGWRTTNLFSENINLLVSSRDIIFAEELQPERATNYGINFTQKFDTDNITGFFTTDYYRTDFQNQIFPDYDTDPTLATIKNFTGKSISNGFQAEVFIKIKKRLEIKTGYNFLDVYRMTDGEKQLLPFNSRHKVVTVIGYTPLSERWRFDMNAHWYGTQRLPSTASNPAEFQREDFSKPYTLFNAQFSYDIKKFEFYAGCENVFNFRQNRPILNWQNPFGQYFDTSSVWGPTRGREIYVGVRYRIKE